MKILRTKDLYNRKDDKGNVIPGKLNCSAALAWKIRKDPTFPKPLDIAGQFSGWTEQSIDEWLARQGAGVSVQAPRSRGRRKADA